MTPPAWRRGPVVFGDPNDPLVAAWTFDDRVGVALVLRVLRRLVQAGERPARPTWLAFTMHEEGGCHGAKNLARRLAPEIFIAVDGAPLPTPSGGTLDGGPGVWAKDSKTFCDPRLVRGFQAAADRAGVPLQTLLIEGAYSDASSVYDAGFVERVVTFGHVRENGHGFEISQRRNFDQTEAVLWEFVRHPIA